MRYLGATIAFALCAIAGCLSPGDTPSWQKSGAGAGNSGNNPLDFLTMDDPNSFEWRCKPGHAPVTNPDD